MVKNAPFFTSRALTHRGEEAEQPNTPSMSVGAQSSKLSPSSPTLFGVALCRALPAFSHQIQ